MSADINTVTIELAGEQITLLPEHALFWPRESTLFIADTHWGKDAAFRANAMPIPGGILEADLARLTNILTRTEAQRLIVLGDLLHAKKGRAASLFKAVSAWRDQHGDLDVLLVRGNHDDRAGDPPDEWRFRCVDAPSLLPPFVLRHEPGVDARGYVLSGHFHPGVVLTGAGRQSVKLPCFLFGTRLAILPAFGAFTGLAAVRPRVGDRVFAVVDGEILPLT
jgi:DNA ligase-associated metallophosphoesterase